MGKSKLVQPGASWLACLYLVWPVQCPEGPEDSTDTADPHITHNTDDKPKCRSNATQVLCRQDWVVSGPHRCLPSLILTLEQRRRRSLYFQAVSTAPNDLKAQRTVVVTPTEVQSWITRELQAITLESDVKLLCEVVLGCLAKIETLLSTGRRYFNIALILSHNLILFLWPRAEQCLVLDAKSRCLLTPDSTTQQAQNIACALQVSLT